MEEIRKLLLMQKKKNDRKDLCPACEENLYYSKRTSKRIGILGEDDKILGWACPFCMSQFDLDDKMAYITEVKNRYGRA